MGRSRTRRIVICLAICVVLLAALAIAYVVVTTPHASSASSGEAATAAAEPDDDAWMERTLASIEKVAAADEAHGDGCAYVIDCKGGYFFDEFLEQGGASSDAEVTQFVLEKAFGSSALGGILAGCSSFTCATEDGDRLFCRNFDQPRSNIAIYRTDPRHGRYASICTTDLKYVGISESNTDLSLIDKYQCLAVPYVCMDGMNSEGLAVSVYICNQGVYADDTGTHATCTDICTSKPDLTTTTMMRMVLDKCATVDEALEMIGDYDLHDSTGCPFHYTVSDASGRSVCLEWTQGTCRTDLDGTARELTVTQSDGTDPLVVTNFALKQGYYESEADMDGLDRWRDTTDALEATGNVVDDENEAMDILSITGIRTRAAANQADSGLGATLYSVVYNLTDRTVMIVANEHYGDPAYTFTYSFSDFFGK